MRACLRAHVCLPWPSLPGWCFSVPPALLSSWWPEPADNPEHPSHHSPCSKHRNTQVTIHAETLQIHTPINNEGLRRDLKPILSLKGHFNRIQHWHWKLFFKFQLFFKKSTGREGQSHPTYSSRTVTPWFALHQFQSWKCTNLSFRLPVWAHR